MVVVFCFFLFFIIIIIIIIIIISSCCSSTSCCCSSKEKEVMMMMMIMKVKCRKPFHTLNNDRKFPVIFLSPYPFLTAFISPWLPFWKIPGVISCFSSTFSESYPSTKNSFPIPNTNFFYDTLHHNPTCDLRPFHLFIYLFIFISIR